MLDVLYSQKGLMNVDGKTSSAPRAVTAALNDVESVPADVAQIPDRAAERGGYGVVDEPIHIWLYTDPASSPTAPRSAAYPFDLVQQRWEGVRVAS